MKSRLKKTSCLILGMVVTLSCGLSAPQTRTPAALPITTPIPGWAKFEGDGLEVWLPESFVGGDLNNKLAPTIEKLEELGPETASIIEQINQNPSAWEFWAFDTQVGESGFLTIINVIHEGIPSSMTIETYVELVVSKLPADLKIEQKKVRLARYDSIVIEVEKELPNDQVQLIYFIKDEDIVWGITYYTGKSEYQQRLPIFEQSADTFQVQP